MNNNLRVKNVIRTLTMVLSLALLPMLGHAQTFQTYTGGDGGTWDQGVTPDWNGAAAWQGGFDDAYFNTPGTVNVSDANGTVTANYLEFNQSGAATITGGTLEENPWLTWGTDPSPGYETFIQMDGGAGPVTIASQIELSDLGGNEQDYINNYSSSNLTLNNIDFGAYTLQPTRTSDRRVNLSSYSAAGSITLNGTYTDSATYGYGEFNITGGSSGVINFTANSNFNGFSGGQINNFAGGTENLYTDKFTANTNFAEQQANGGANEINLEGALTIQSGLYDSMKNSGTASVDGVSDYGYAHINQATAAVSTWVGHINLDGTNLNLSSVAGGRLIVDNFGGDAPLGLIISGSGTVVLADVNGNGYDERDGQGLLRSTSTVAADLQTGSTTLIENSNVGTSAFGTGTNFGRDAANPGTDQNPNYISNNPVVKLESGATLGGNGGSAPQIVAEAADSVIAPGDAGQANLGIHPSIGLLTLSGGLDAENGLTMDFKLTGGLSNTANPLMSTPAPGVDNDAININGLTLNGPVTVNFTALTALALDTPYTLMFGSGWTSNPTGAPLTFDFIAPAGYTLDPNYGSGKGYIFSRTPANTSLTVEFIPEPSTYGLMGLGLLALVAIGRFRRLAA
jgi:hypothetical protein